MAHKANDELVIADKGKVEKVLSERDWSANLLAEKMGIASSTLSRKLKADGFLKVEYRLMCMILGKDLDELLYVETPEPTKANAKDILSTNMIIDEIKKAYQEIESIHEDILAIAHSVAELHKMTAEIKGQAQINADEIIATNRKCVEINSTVNKIFGNMKYKAIGKQV